ncbi:VOC family protein [Umezawaea sp. Da 62-37]|uniref:VOC family protein n=1 Tax=Umezawaea sp. Da 62-37 TaxID=3075927 RepID=UPI0028F6F046|nr:VOC family protein [Umezawaea sp. Da 62-37]WNV91275.1 VOC family protein [Umezawaea sp. Da 62-37]
MTATPHHITIASVDPFALASFWSRVTGAPLADDDFAGDPEASVLIPGGTPLLFVRVPDAKTSRNRTHLDLRPDSTRDEEVERLLGIGAALVDDRRTPDGRGWVVLADPEGNEFCVERSAAEKADLP